MRPLYLALVLLNVLGGCINLAFGIRFWLDGNPLVLMSMVGLLFSVAGITGGLWLWGIR